jgi:hypothetical protein
VFLHILDTHPFTLTMDVSFHIRGGTVSGPDF